MRWMTEDEMVGFDGYEKKRYEDTWGKKKKKKKRKYGMHGAKVMGWMGLERIKVG